VTLFLVVMAEICRGVEGPTRMLGYADDWVILTINKTLNTAEVQLQSATNTVSRWANGNGFPISTEKTKAMLIYRRKPKVSRNPKMKIWIGTEKIAMVKHHRILGLVIDERINCNKHFQDAKERAGKKSA
jgi:hypothetical protein